MLDLSYHMPVSILYGEGAVRKHAALFREAGKKCMIVTGRQSAKACGALDDVQAALEEAGVESILFDGVEPNPLLSTCKRAGDLAREWGAQFIIGIGGGSPLDAAKAVSVFASQPLEAEALYQGGHAHLPFFLVGTTAGTGSEVTPYSILTVDRTGRKQSVGGLFAAACFCDWRYTASLPWPVTAATALDALSHCIEGYFCTRADTLSDLFALEGARLVLEVLTGLGGEKPLSDKDRQKLYAASIYGGLTITRTGTSFCHAMGYFLTEQHQTAHGTACAVFLPAYLRRGFECETRKADRLAAETDFTLGELCSIVESFTDFSPFPLSEAEREALCRRWTESGKFATAPGGFAAQDALELLDALFPER